MPDPQVTFWQSFTYDPKTNLWGLAPGLSPMDIIPICHAKQTADWEAVAAVKG